MLRATSIVSRSFARNDLLLDISLSQHWHGFFQAGSSWADGPVGVTQCPISPGHSFLYTFQTANQAGTFWYHSHLYNTVLTLGDWYHVPAPSAGAAPTPSATLINGLGRYAGGPASPLAIINVVSGKRYRFRLVSLSCDPNYVFSIDGHTLNIIEVDSIDVTPHTVDNLQIFAGQRYSFVLTANQPVDNYWVRANPNRGTTGFVGGLNSAILRYAGAAVADPSTTRTPFVNPLAEANLHPLTSPAAPGLPTPGGVDFAQHFTFSIVAGKWRVNGQVFDPPTVPVLLQIMSGALTPGSILPAGSLYHLPPNKDIELSFSGGGPGAPHPIHLHGHAFSVVRSAGSSIYNYLNPVQRDVVSVGAAGDNVTIRFRTDNPGPWIMHCHIDWHFENGLAVVFAEDTATINSATVTPAAWDDLCPIYDALDPADL
ncbi:Acyl-coenzyme A oxidase 2 [Asterophora parasitica]|uniref:laccase n=1 Tax=Asterophora parasitica TaxID=117018 RepID=A0A9P7G7G9_9AGAR|nr:Acyl-coenzyme A oxidase 2 [Asterophora parasitica]